MTDTEWLQYWIIVTTGNKDRALLVMEMADDLCARVGVTREEFIADREAEHINFIGDPTEPKRSPQ